MQEPVRFFHFLLSSSHVVVWEEDEFHKEKMQPQEQNDAMDIVEEDDD